MTFDNFTYYATDGVTGVRSSAPDAACNLVVKPLNDPPKPRSFRNYAVAGVKTYIGLNSSDVDNSLPFKNAYITRYPRHGKLLSADATGNISACAVADPNATDAGKTWLFHCRNPQTCTAGSGGANCTAVLGVGYLLTDWTALDIDSSSDSGVVGSDSFEYVVQDIRGYNSTVATAHIVLTTPLVVEASDAVVRPFSCQLAFRRCLVPQSRTRRSDAAWYSFSFPPHGCVGRFR